MQIMECAQTTHIQYAVSALFCNNIFLIISGNKNITFNWVFFKLYTVFFKIQNTICLLKSTHLSLFSTIHCQNIFKIEEKLKSFKSD